MIIYVYFLLCFIAKNFSGAANFSNPTTSPVFTKIQISVLLAFEDQAHVALLILFQNFLILICLWLE